MSTQYLAWFTQSTFPLSVCTENRNTIYSTSIIYSWYSQFLTERGNFRQGTSGLCFNMALIHWINTLQCTSAMLLNDVTELCTPQGARTIVDIILLCINNNTGANGGSKITLPIKGSPQDQVRAAIRLLGQRVGWGNLAPALFEHEAADQICSGDVALVTDLLNDLHSTTATSSSSSSSSSSIDSSPSLLSGCRL